MKFAFCNLQFELAKATRGYRDQGKLAFSPTAVVALALLFLAPPVALAQNKPEKDHREALEESWNYAADIPAKPYAVESAVQAVITHLAEGQPKFAGRKPAEFIESGPLLELDRSGFIDRLYAGR
ncbi:MAG: hypothetical protein ACREQK_18895 [Candidatus Binatia bacterium]